MADPYDFKEIEERWLARWQERGAWRAARTPSGEKRYVLEMFPYPSGDMHMGHVENYTIGDAIARFWKMCGYEVLHPFGYDAFGLPAENAAITRGGGVHPRDWTYANIDRFTASCKRLAFSYDWDRSFATCDPEFFRWNQWIFLRLLERDLAYRKTAKVNWCPSCRTVLANEQISSGVCWRCGSVPEVRDLEQWFFRTTAYAQQLLDDMEELEWGDAVLTQQRNWIGRSEGARVTFRVADSGEEVEVFTTRPDTLYGVTFFVFAPEHPLARELAERAGKADAYDAFVADVRRRSEVDRVAMDSERLAFDLEARVVNPLNGEAVPAFAAEYVLMEYGTGAIMAVPAHDQRDFEFARQLDLPVRVVIAPEGGASDEDDLTEALEGDGVMVNSGPFDGTPAPAEGKRKVIEHLEREGTGRGEVNFRLRDWLISRQRYWGTPIPVVYCDGCGIVPVPDDQLPVTLPDDVDLTRRSTTSDAAGTQDASPLASATEWVNTSCPSCEGPARRETDTMDTFVDSSWYQFRFCDPHNGERPFDPDPVNAWLPVDQYTGGIEHAVMHLIYARFFTKVMNDMGMLSFREPFRRLMNHGMITMGGKVMSKSLGNVVDPSEVLDRFGADALRVFMMFIGPPDQDYDWPDEGAQAVVGAHRFIERVWRLVAENLDRVHDAGPPSGASDLRKTIHRTIEACTEDYDRFSFNTAVAKLMTLQRELSGNSAIAPVEELREGIDVLLHCLAPLAPYVTEELWHRLGEEGSIHDRPWPTADAELARLAQVTMVLQVDGKVRDRVEVPADISEEDAIAVALESAGVRRYLEDVEPDRVIARPPRMVNVLTGRRG